MLRNEPTKLLPAAGLTMIVSLIASCKQSHPHDNDAMLASKINTALKTLFNPGEIFSNTPAAMSTEDFRNCVTGNNKTVYNYIKVGVTTLLEFFKQ